MKPGNRKRSALQEQVGVPTVLDPNLTTAFGNHLFSIHIHSNELLKSIIKVENLKKVSLKQSLILRTIYGFLIVIFRVILLCQVV